jgi:ATP-dependent HslUV protease ATP-binding subunit HslU
MKINTRNILFVGAGAFEKVKPTELAIELQGRLPIQAKMEALTQSDFVKILKNTEHNLLL